MGKKENKERKGKKTTQEAVKKWMQEEGIREDHEERGLRQVAEFWQKWESRVPEVVCEEDLEVCREVLDKFALSRWSEDRPSGGDLFEARQVVRLFAKLIKQLEKLSPEHPRLMDLEEELDK